MRLSLRRLAIGGKGAREAVSMLDRVNLSALGEPGALCCGAQAGWPSFLTSVFSGISWRRCFPGPQSAIALMLRRLVQSPRRTIAVMDLAAGTHVLVMGVESETQLGHAALHRLPCPQRAFTPGIAGNTSPLPRWPVISAVDGVRFSVRHSHAQRRPARGLACRDGTSKTSVASPTAR